MSTIQQNLTRLQNAKTAIATAITNKGGTVSSGDGFEDFASDIENIQTESKKGFDIEVTITSSTLNPYLCLTISQLYTFAVVDCGDGTSKSTINGRTDGYSSNISHTYSSVGTYTISVDCSHAFCYFSGTYTISSSAKSSLINNGSYYSGYSDDYTRSINRIYLYENVNISENGVLGCDNLTDIYFKVRSPPPTSIYSFRGLTTKCKIHIPPGTLSAYTSAANYPSAATYTYIEDA